MDTQSKVPKNIFETAEFARCFPDSALLAVNCNLCGSSESTVLFTEGVFRVRQCASCGFVYISPQPTQEALDTYYAQFYPATSEDTVSSWSHQASFRQARRILRRYYPDGGKLLDVGCGLGIFLQTLGPEWELTGVDPDQNACDRARHAVPRAEIIHGTVLSLQPSEQTFDVVTLLASLEHMPDPASALRRIRTMIKPRGLILVRVPYTEWFYRMKRAIPSLPVQFGAPRHLYDFSPRTLRLMLERNGYRLQRLYVGSRERVSRPAVAAAILAAKTVSKVAYYITGGHWFVPFCGSLVAVARSTTTD